MPASHDAFISYSHRADGALAPVLERGIERLARSTFQLRAIDAFRDQTSLSASPGVWTGIMDHLQGSRWFIFLASPESAASPWCTKELRWWLETRGTAQILIVLTAGTIEWDDAKGDFDWTRTDALPRDAVAGRFTEVPLYVDLRWVRDAGPINARDPRLRNAWLDLTAPVRGVPKDQLDGEDVRHLRRTRILARTGLATIVVAAILAIWQAIEATQQRAQAEHERELAVSRQLAAQATEMRVREPVLALLLGAQAHAIAPTSEATAGLIALARAMPLDRIVEHDARFSSVAARQGTGDAWIGDADGNVWRLGLNDGAWSRVHTGRGGLLAGPSAQTVSDDGRAVAFGGYGGTITVWRDGKVDTLDSPIEREQIVLDLAFSPDGLRLAAAGQRLDTMAGNGFIVLHHLDGRPAQIVDSGSGAARVRFTPDGHRLVVGGDGGFLQMIQLDGRARPRAIPVSGSGSVTGLGFTDSGRRLFVAWSLGRIEIIDLEQGKGIDWFVAIDHGLVEGMAVSADGGTVYTTHTDGAVVRWVKASGIQRWDSTELYRHATTPAGVALVDGGTRLASVDRDGRIFVARDLHVTAPARLRWQAGGPFDDAWLDRDTERLALRSATGDGWYSPESGQFNRAPDTGSEPGRTRLVRPDASSFDVLATSGEQIVRRRGADVVWTAGSDRVLPGSPAVTAAAFAPDGRTLYVLAGDAVQAWDAATGTPRGQAVTVGQNAGRLAIDPAGRWIVVLHNAPMQINKLERGVRHPAVSVLSLPDLGVRVRTTELALGATLGLSALFSPDGASLLLMDDAAVNVLDMTSMRRLETSIPLGGAKVLGWMHGRWPLWLSDARSGRLLTLDLRGDTLADWACALAGRALTEDEWVRFLGTTRGYAPRCRARP